jgi:hypothetical protein
MDEVHDHDPAAVWCALHHTTGTPGDIEPLRTSRDTAVYRFHVGDSRIIAKRCPVATALVERTVYEQILPALALPRLRYFGASTEADETVWWLFIEEAQGPEYRSDRAADRAAAAQWLATLHGEIERLEISGSLPTRSPEHYEQALAEVQRSLTMSGIDGYRRRAGREAREAVIAHCENLSGRWSELVDACRLGPETLVHGDLVAHNARLVPASSGPVFMPFDWEKAGWGTPAEDLANVDLVAYRQALGSLWPELGARELRQLAGAGRVFRCIVFLQWLQPDLRDDSEHSIEQLDTCRSWLDAIMERSPWLS